MKASVYTNYGAADVLHISEVNQPSPQANEVLIKVAATTVTAADIMMRVGRPLIGRLYLGLTKPKRTILGFDFAGEVIAVGDAVSQFKIGDKVFGGTTTLGCYAEYLCVNENDVITTMPDNISYEEAAPVSGSAITVMNFLKGLGQIKAGDKVLINGASGSLGTYAVQIAKLFGAEVTGVCSTRNVALVESLGADYVIDYTQMDFTKTSEHYDIIFDTVSKSSFKACKPILSSQGIYMSSVAGGGLLLSMLLTAWGKGKKAKTASTGLLNAKQRLAYLIELKALLQNGQLKTVIDTSYPLSKMAEAHQYVETGRKRGNVVIMVSH